MKQIILILVTFILSSNAKTQTHQYPVAGAFTFPCYGQITTAGDTLNWFWDMSEVKAYTALQLASYQTATASATTVTTQLNDSLTRYYFGSATLTGNGTQDTFHVTVPTGYIYSFVNFVSGATVGTDSLATYGSSLSGTTLIINFYNKAGKTIPPLGSFVMTYFLGKKQY